MVGLPVKWRLVLNPTDYTYQDFGRNKRILGIAMESHAPRRFSELAVFDTRFYILVRSFDELGQGRGVCGCSRPQFHVAHELAGTL